LAQTDRTWRHYSEVSHYSCVWSHLRDYRVRLNTVQREELADYFLPEMPSRFLERHVPTRAVHLARRQRRKAKTDVLTPIVHVLVALIERRKAAMHRLLTRTERSVIRSRQGRARHP